MSTPVGEQSRWDGAGTRGVPGRTRRALDDVQPGVEPVTVEQVLARQGSATGRRRAARRVEERPVEEHRAEQRRAEQRRAEQRRAEQRRADASGRARRYDVPDVPVVRAGLPPVPGGVQDRPAPQAVRPPVPGAARVAPQLGLPPVPVIERDLDRERQQDRHQNAALWEPDLRPSRRSGPIPPLPGLSPPPSADAPQPPKGRARRPVRPPASPGRRRLRRALVALAVLIGGVVLYHLALYFYVDQKIGRVEALATDGPEVLAPALQAAAETYLVVGTGVPGQDGGSSVTTLLASVSADRDRAVLVSFPPTALVDTPECRTPDGSLRNPTTEAFASSLLEGGPSCMVRAVQQLSGLRIDHYLGVDLAELPGMVDALGGVPVCITPSEATSAAAMPLEAGPARLTGSTAAGYLEPGDTGVDVTGAAVAERAQRLLTSTLRAAMSTSTLTDPVATATFLNRAADALTVDVQTTLADLRVLAGSLGDLSGDAVQRAVLPVSHVGYQPVGTDEAYVLLDGAGTRKLFDRVIKATSVPAEFRSGATASPQPPVAAEAPPPPPEPVPAPGALTAAPAEVTVNVLNGTGTSGLAKTVAEALRAQGFGVGTVGNEPGTVNESVVRHGPTLAEQARTVAAAVPGAELQPNDAIGETVQLVIGPGFSGVVPVTVGAPVVAAPAEAAADTAVVPTTPAAAPVSCG